MYPHPAQYKKKNRNTEFHAELPFSYIFSMKIKVLGILTPLPLLLSLKKNDHIS
jgi:hypothetical protein